MLDPAAVAKLAARLEPCHSFIYFAPEAGLGFHGLGLEGASGYFASRSAPMGPVSAEVVVATFYNFKPSMVREAMDGVWDRVSPATVLDARHEAVAGGLRRMLGDDADAPAIAEITELCRQAASTAEPAGRALYAGHAGLPWPDDPLVAFWHAITLLREHRGDTHVAALLGAGVGPVEALITHVASGLARLPQSLLQATRGWTDEEWAAAEAGLRERGLLAEDGTLTDAGALQRDEIEAATTTRSMAPYEVLGAEGVERVSELVAPFSRTIRNAMFG